MPAGAIIDLILGIGELALPAAGHLLEPQRLDSAALNDLGDDSKRAFIAGLVFVAAHDDVLGRDECDEIYARMAQLGSHRSFPDIERALQARSDVGPTAEQDNAAFAKALIQQLPEGRARELLLRAGVGIALLGDFERQREALVMLADGAGFEASKLDALIAKETKRIRARAERESRS